MSRGRMSRRMIQLKNRIMKSKKELRDSYREMKSRVGVFRIRNLVNEKVYIEGSVNLDKIWNRHRVELNFGNHRNEQLQSEWNRYGEENFRFEILGEIEEPGHPRVDLQKESRKLAAMFIDEARPFGERGYHSESMKS
jgi:hypothetical protein